MNRLLTYPILVLLLLIMTPCNLKAGNTFDSHTLYLTKVIGSTSNNDIDLGSNGHRVPSRPILCTISQDSGIDVPNIEPEEIISYEIYDENLNCIASFTDESDFITYIFSCSGEIEIHLNLADYSLIGFLYL